MQALGFVDAVWSDDGDSFMLRCGMLMKQHNQGNTNVRNHICTYRVDTSCGNMTSIAKGCILFEMLAGFDYM